MIKKLLIALTIGLFCNCKTDNSKNSNELTARQIFNKVSQTHGKETFFNSNINFEITNARYEVSTPMGRYNFKMTRVVDEKINVISYDGGFLQHTINSEIQDLNTASYSVVERSIFGFPFSYFIPFTLDNTDVHLTLLPETTIQLNPYYAVKTSFLTKDDNPKKDEIILYIDKKDFTIVYLALDFGLISSKKMFKRCYNIRSIDGVLFYDYALFVDDPEATLEELYLKFNNSTLEHVATIEVNNPTVTARK